MDVGSNSTLSTDNNKNNNLILKWTQQAEYYSFLRSLLLHFYTSNNSGKTIHQKHHSLYLSLYLCWVYLHNHLLCCICTPTYNHPLSVCTMHQKQGGGNWGICNREQCKSCFAFRSASPSSHPPPPISSSSAAPFKWICTNWEIPAKYSVVVVAVEECQRKDHGIRIRKAFVIINSGGFVIFLRYLLYLSLLPLSRFECDAGIIIIYALIDCTL